MANNLKYSTTLRNARADAITTELGNASIIRIYDGTQPASPQVAVGAQTLGAELVCGTPFAAAASGGVLTAGAISNDASANNSITATWFRHFKSDGTTAVIDGTVGTTGADLNLNSVSITAGQTVSVSSYVITGGNA